MKKKFSVQISSSEKSKWLFSDAQFVKLFHETLEPLLVLISGPRPTIKVTLEDQKPARH